MQANYATKTIGIGILITLVLFGGFFLSKDMLSGLVVGVPSSCKAQANLAAPEIFDLYIGETATADVQISKVMCGISYVRLFLNGIPKGLYTVGPTYIPVITPKATKNFTIYFDVPLGTEEKSYGGVYTLYTNEGTYTFGEFTVNINTREKPKIQVQPVIRVSKDEIPEKIAISMWYATVFFAALIAAILIGFAYFALSQKHGAEAALKREENAIYKAIGVSPLKKAGFESAFKKRKKPRS